jgi:hypothetical protein
VTEYLLDYQWIFDARYNFNRTTALFTGFYFYPKNPFKSLRPGHRLVLLLLSRGADCLVEATPHKYTMKARQINSGFGHQCR